MDRVRTYKDLKVWKTGLDIFDLVYEISSNFPEEERFGLTTQMRRCSVSIASNIAEGWGREQTKSFINYLRISRGSLFELETQLIMCSRQNFVNHEDFLKLSEMIDYESRMLKNLMTSLNRTKVNQLRELEVEYFTNEKINFRVENADDCAERNPQNSEPYK